NGNNFRSINGVINRVERVDTSYADIDRSKLRNIQFLGNNFNNISTQTENPLIVTHNQNTASSVWTVSSDSRLPFSGYATTVTGMVAENAIRTSSNNTTYTMPYTETEKGSSKDQIHVRWSTSVKGKIHLTMRCD
ncbi:MAG: right-handed parallel beta-helix repeat-containing protein, partial [Rhodobacteraceae bacterium]|nr:right-handed parallel beta-helix repeat-containing protein [Paracoccaceae bacterium]